MIVDGNSETRARCQHETCSASSFSLSFNVQLSGLHTSHAPHLVTSYRYRPPHGSLGGRLVALFQGPTHNAGGGTRANRMILQRPMKNHGELYQRWADNHRSIVHGSCRYRFQVLTHGPGPSSRKPSLSMREAGRKSSKLNDEHRIRTREGNQAHTTNIHGNATS